MCKNIAKANYVRVSAALGCIATCEKCPVHHNVLPNWLLASLFRSLSKQVVMPALMQAESTIVCPPQATPARVLPAPYQAMHTMPHPCNGYSNAANSIQSRSPHLLASPHPQKVAPVGNLSTISPATPHQVCQSSTPQSNTAVLSQHPYMLHQTAAQHPSPSDRLRAAARRGTKRAPSVEADSPAEPQVGAKTTNADLIDFTVTSMIQCYG